MKKKSPPQTARADDSKPKLKPYYVRCSRERPGLCVVEAATGREVFHCPRLDADCVFEFRKRLEGRAEEKRGGEKLIHDFIE